MNNVASPTSPDQSHASGPKPEPKTNDVVIRPERLRRMEEEASALTEVQIADLRNRLKADPKDLEARLLLILHRRETALGDQDASRADIDLFLGLIEIHSRNPVFFTLDWLPGGSPKVRDQVAEKWLEAASVRHAIEPTEVVYLRYYLKLSSNWS